MGRLVLTGTENNGFRHRYSFDKVKGFKEGFVKFMSGLGFDGEKIENRFVIRHWKDTEEGEIEVVSFLSVFDFVDDCWFFDNDIFEVDVFFGRDKVIILVRVKGKKEERKKMLNELEKNIKWISKNELEKRLKKYKKLVKSKEIAAN